MDKLKNMWAELLRFIFRYQSAEVDGLLWDYWGWTNTIVVETQDKTVRIKPYRFIRQAIRHRGLENCAKGWSDNLEWLLPSGESLNWVNKE